MPDNECRTIRMNTEILDRTITSWAVVVMEAEYHRHHLYQHGGIGITMEEEVEEEIGIITMVGEEIDNNIHIVLNSNTNHHHRNHRIGDGRDNHHVLLPQRHHFTIRISNVINNDSDNSFATHYHPPYPKKCACPMRQ